MASKMLLLGMLSMLLSCATRGASAQGVLLVNNVTRITTPDAAPYQANAVTPAGGDGICGNPPTDELYLFPCYGTMSVYASFRDPATTSDLYWTWAEARAKVSFPTLNAGTTACTTFDVLSVGVSPGEFGGSSIVDVLYINASTRYFDVVPSIDDKGISATEEEGKRAATLTFPLGPAGTTYSLHQYKGSLPEERTNAQTACGVELFFTDITPQAEFDESGGDGEYKITKLDPESEYWFAVIASKPNGYKAMYQLQQVNEGARGLAVSATLVLLGALAMLL